MGRHYLNCDCVTLPTFHKALTHYRAIQAKVEDEQIRGSKQNLKWQEKLAMLVISRFHWRTSLALFLASSLVFACSSTPHKLTPTSITHSFTPTSPLGALTQISSDPYTNKTSQHKTEVEPDSFAFGNTVVAAFKVGRYFKGGASNIGWATSITGGRTWTHGF